MISCRSGFRVSLANHGPKNFRRGESNGPNRADMSGFQGTFPLRHFSASVTAGSNQRFIDRGRRFGLNGKE
jgi:hypothetical protein